jgi:hypothetical protein
MKGKIINCKHKNQRTEIPTAVLIRPAGMRE